MEVEGPAGEDKKRRGKKRRGPKPALCRSRLAQTIPPKGRGRELTSVGERADVGGPAVRRTPLGAEAAAGERVLLGLAHRCFGHERQRLEPLHRAAGRVVVEVLAEVEL